MSKSAELISFDDLVTRQVNETLEKGALASSFLGVLSAGILFIMGRLGIVKNIEVPTVWAFIGGTYSLIIWVLARAKRIQNRGTWFVMIGFCCFPGIIYAIALLTLPSGTATYITGPPGYISFFMIALTGFAFDFKLSLATGFFCALQYSIFAHLALPFMRELKHSDALLLQDLTDEAFYHFKSLTMAMTGVTIGIVSRHVRTLIEDTLVRQRETMMVSRLFGQFVSNEVKDKILSQADTVGQGEKKTVAILFSDIRGFTGFSEKIAPEKVVETLNEYLDAMVRAIASAGGTIDKFIGDAIMAVFGGVMDVENPADAALAAALLMRASLDELNAKRSEAGLPPIANGIGIHYGTVLQGAIGSAERKDFTVIGDVVNSASRLEGLCKDFGTDLVFSDAVYSVASASVKSRCRRLGEAKVKGREQALAVWTIDA